MKEKLSIIVTGVGGQGVITAAALLGKAAVAANVNVLVSEVHGMAQRGGVVDCTVRMGKIHSPLVTRGSADVILSSEPVEALRQIEKANDETIVITDINPVIPSTVATTDQKYPRIKEVVEELKKQCQVITLDACSLAEQAGSIVAKNIVLLGALSALEILPFSHDLLLETVLNNLPKKYASINQKAFELGKNMVLKQRNDDTSLPLADTCEAGVD
ncbi:MAG TPA: indolepyruvate ferredoxin oxidoreductase subunit beta [Thermoplasmata archaeon]|nr:indolepyruvate ferredoxin oxidoreductase subunit beta [Thermoplasmata archaeon]